jgi:ATP-dependent Lon protease
MADTDTVSQALPVIPVPDGVVFPATVVTIALESDEALGAVAAARSGDDHRVLLVPQIEGRSARVGVIAQVENAGELPGGGLAAIVRGLQRARLGAGVVTERSGLWVQAEPVEESRPSPRVEALGRELRVVL